MPGHDAEDKKRRLEDQVIDQVTTALAKEYRSPGLYRRLAQIMVEALDYDAFRKLAAVQGYSLRVDPELQEEPGGVWWHCSPELLQSGVMCADTPRRACPCQAGRDHWIALRPSTGQHAAQQ